MIESLQALACHFPPDPRSLLDLSALLRVFVSAHVQGVVYTSLFQHGYLKYVSAPLYMIMHTITMYVSALVGVFVSAHVHAYVSASVRTVFICMGTLTIV